MGVSQDRIEMNQRERENLLAALETANPVNLPIYNALGFAVTGAAGSAGAAGAAGADAFCCDVAFSRRAASLASSKRFRISAASAICLTLNSPKVSWPR